MQTAATMNIKTARAGMLAYPLRHSKIDTWAAEGNVSFGYAVVKGTSPGHVKHAALAADTFVGFAIESKARVVDSSVAAPHYHDDDAVNV
jgi:hypothetical protein